MVAMCLLGCSGWLLGSRCLLEYSTWLLGVCYSVLVD